MSMNLYAGRHLQRVTSTLGEFREVGPLASSFRGLGCSAFIAPLAVVGSIVLVYTGSGEQPLTVVRLRSPSPASGDNGAEPAAQRFRQALEEAVAQAQGGWR